MDRKTRRTAIRVETHELEVFRFVGRESTAYCERCGAYVRTVEIGRSDPDPKPDETLGNDHPVLADEPAKGEAK